MTIDHHYWECDCECHCGRQVEKEAFESHSQKQRKAFTSGSTMIPQNKANISLAASSIKTSSKSSLSPAPKKQPNTPWMDLSSKLASNGKLTNDKCKKHLENNLCLYCGAGDHKLHFCPKKQITVTPKDHSASVTTDTLVVTSEKSSENREQPPELCID